MAARQMCRWSGAAEGVGDGERFVQDGYAVARLALAHGTRRHRVHAVELAKGDKAALFTCFHQVHHRRTGAAIRRERFARRFVLYKLEGKKDTEAAHLAETRVLVHQLFEPGAENLLADEGRVFDDSLLG